MMAIETRYAGATRTKPARIIATANGRRHIISYPAALSQEAAHRCAAEELATESGWLKDDNRLVAGETARGYVFLFVPAARLRIHHCEGNRNAWLLARIRRDGSDSDSFGSYTTALSLDSLLWHAGNLAPKPGEIIEFIATPSVD